MIREFFSKIRTKNIHPKVYSLVLKDFDKGDNILCTTFAYSLEEAIGKAKKEASLFFPDVNMAKYKVDLFNYEELEDLLSEYTEESDKSKSNESSATTEIRGKIMNAISSMAKKKMGESKKRQSLPDTKVKPPTLSTEAILMKEIIEKKDLNMLEKSKDMLKPAEIKFIQNKIKNNK